jgi:hypothetical protein
VSPSSPRHPAEQARRERGLDREARLRERHRLDRLLVAGRIARAEPELVEARLGDVDESFDGGEGGTVDAVLRLAAARCEVALDRVRVVEGRRVGDCSKSKPGSD